MQGSKVSAVLFVKHLQRTAEFYVNALGMHCSFSDDDHAKLHCHDFQLIVHQIPQHIAAEIDLESPPERRVWGALRLDYPVRNLAESRKLAQTLGGGIDDAPPTWAERGANFYLGHDPEGNQFGVSEQAA